MRAEALRTSKRGTWLVSIFILVGNTRILVGNTTRSWGTVEAEANWADEISREGAQGTWAPRNAFLVGECGVVVELLTLPCLAVVGIFEHL